MRPVNAIASPHLTNSSNQSLKRKILNPQVGQDGAFWEQNPDGSWHILPHIPEAGFTFLNATVAAQVRGAFFVFVFVFVLLGAGEAGGTWFM